MFTYYVYIKMKMDVNTIYMADQINRLMEKYGNFIKIPYIKQHLDNHKNKVPREWHVVDMGLKTSVF